MNHPFPHTDSCSRRNLPSTDRQRHAKIGKGVDDGGANVVLGNPPVKLAGEKTISQALEPIHHVFGKAAPVIAGFLLPRFPSLGRNLGQDDIAWMVVSPKCRTLAGRYRRLGSPPGDGGMRPFGVVGAIGRDLSNSTFRLRQQVGEHFAVVPVSGGHLDTNDFLRGDIDRQVSLALSATLANAVLAHVPFALAEDLQTGGIHHDMRGSVFRATENLHLQWGCPARHVGMVRHRKVERSQAHQRLEQAFGGSVGRTEQGLERQVGLYRHVRVKPRLATAYRPRRRPAFGNTRLLEPDRQVAAID